MRSLRVKAKILLAAAALCAAAALAFSLAPRPLRLCLVNGDSGRVIASYPAPEGAQFSVGFIHSVNKSPVEEYYRVEGDRLFLVSCRYMAFGAGVATELEEGWQLEYPGDGSMVITGIHRPMDSLSYIVGTVSDHVLTIGSETISLRELCGRNATVRFQLQRRLFS